MKARPNTTVMNCALNCVPRSDQSSRPSVGASTDINSKPSPADQRKSSILVPTEAWVTRVNPASAATVSSDRRPAPPRRRRGHRTALRHLQTTATLKAASASSVASRAAMAPSRHRFAAGAHSWPPQNRPGDGEGQFRVSMPACGQQPPVPAGDSDHLVAQRPGRRRHMRTCFLGRRTAGPQEPVVEVDSHHTPGDRRGEVGPPHSAGSRPIRAICSWSPACRDCGFTAVCDCAKALCGTGVLQLRWPVCRSRGAGG